MATEVPEIHRRYPRPPKVPLASYSPTVTKSKKHLVWSEKIAIYLRFWRMKAMLRLRGCHRWVVAAEPLRLTIRWNAIQIKMLEACSQYEVVKRKTRRRADMIRGRVEWVRVRDQSSLMLMKVMARYCNQNNLKNRYHLPNSSARNS